MEACFEPTTWGRDQRLEWVFFHAEYIVRASLATVSLANMLLGWCNSSRGIHMAGSTEINLRNNRTAMGSFAESGMLFSEVFGTSWILPTQIEAFCWGFSATAYMYGCLHKKHIVKLLKICFSVPHMLLTRRIFHSSATVTCDYSELFETFQLSLLNPEKKQ